MLKTTFKAHWLPVLGITMVLVAIPPLSAEGAPDAPLIGSDGSDAAVEACGPDAIEGLADAETTAGQAGAGQPTIGQGDALLTASLEPGELLSCRLSCGLAFEACSNQCTPGNEACYRACKDEYQACVNTCP